MMKIGIVCYPSIGGSGVVATELGHQLAERGHEIHFISYEVPFRLQVDDPHIFFHQVDINRYDLFRYPDYALTLAVKMAHVAESFDLDLFHVHYAIPHATSAFLAKQLLGADAPKVVTTLHGTDITLVGQDPAYQAIVKFSMNYSDAITAVSNNLKQQTIDHFQPIVPIEVIHNFFVPRKEWRGNRIKRENFVFPYEKLIIHASNFRNVKSTEEVIETFRLIKCEMPAKLMMVGSGEELNKTKDLADFYHLEEDIFFLGNRSYIDPYLACSDLFLLPSEQESFGLAALEALAYGVPVVCTTAGGLPEVVQEGKNGFLVPIGDVAAMTERSLELLRDKKMHAKFSSHARRWAHENFSAEKIVTQYEECYRRVIQTKETQIEK